MKTNRWLISCSLQVYDEGANPPTRSTAAAFELRTQLRLRLTWAAITEAVKDFTQVASEQQGVIVLAAVPVNVVPLEAVEEEGVPGPVQGDDTAKEIEVG